MADLLYAEAVAKEFRDEVAADPDTVRRKVCTLLGVGDAFRGSGAVRAGKYGSTERDDIEFKSSYVFRNDNGRPDLDYQGRGQVFEAVCALLNRTDGTTGSRTRPFTDSGRRDGSTSVLRTRSRSSTARTARR